MILSCPSCSAKYLVDSHQIKFGRHVKCIRCGHIWYFENINYDPNINMKQSEEIISTMQDSDNNDNSNLPVIYKDNKKNSNLVFILLIFLVLFYAVYTFSESDVSLPLEEFSININNFINYLIKKIIFIVNI